MDKKIKKVLSICLLFKITACGNDSNSSFNSYNKS